MRLKTQTGKAIDVRIQCTEFSTCWIRFDKCLVGFSNRQLSAEIALARIETITHVEFEIPDADSSEDWWRRVLVELDAEYVEAQRVIRADAGRVIKHKKIAPLPVEGEL
jgi:hypothetical protein